MRGARRGGAASTRVGVAVLAGVLACGGCVLRVPPIAGDHPARPGAEAAEVAGVPDVLDLAKATRREPGAHRGVPLHPDMPMHGKPGEHSGAGDDGMATDHEQEQHDGGH